MDTTSHVIIGLGLGALAQADPVVAESSLSYAVILGTVIGSNAPDADCLYKFKGKGSYFRNHRAWSHSLPALPLWGLAVSGAIYPFFTDVSILHLFIWTFLSVILHVGFDLFNVYGTQALRPFHSKWISFDSIPLVDPLVLVLHIIGFTLIPIFGPGNVFLTVYSLTLIHLLLRTFYAHLIKKHLRKYFTDAIRIKLIPRPDLLSWDFLIDTEEEFLFGVYTVTKIKIEHSLSKTTDDRELIQESKNETDISDFIASTEYAHPFVQRRNNGTCVIWKDLRFRMNKSYFPYMAIMYISNDSNERRTYTDKFYSILQYKKVLRGLENKTSIIKKPMKNPHLTY
jgi:inner membrane protein